MGGVTEIIECRERERSRLHVACPRLPARRCLRSALAMTTATATAAAASDLIAEIHARWSAAVRDSHQSGLGHKGTRGEIPMPTFQTTLSGRKTLTL